MSDRAKLDGHRIVPCADLIEWARWFETADRAVATTLRGERGEVEVSTVFLGLDHNFGSGKPLYFETIVFGGPLDGEQERYSTWEEAEAGHRAMVARLGKAEAR